MQIGADRACCFVDKGGHLDRCQNRSFEEFLPVTLSALDSLSQARFSTRKTICATFFCIEKRLVFLWQNVGRRNKSSSSSLKMRSLRGSADSWR